MLLRTLGGLKLQKVNFYQTKPLLLLAYLALEGPKVRRHLWELFWPEATNPANSLRVTVHKLKVLPECVQIVGERVAVQLQTDAQELLKALEVGDPSALTLYQGPFLDGVALSETSTELEEWVYGTREFLARRVRGALLQRAEAEASQGRVGAAAGYAEQAYSLAGAPELEPEEVERLYALLLGGGSPHATLLRREAEEVGLALTLFTESANIGEQTNPVLTVPPAAPSAVPYRVTQVTLLGRAAVHTQTGPLEPLPGKATALLYYLAYHEGWVDRDDLIYLFYPDLGEHRARRNLTSLLAKLRRLPYGEGLSVEPTRLRWRVQTDVGAFKDALRYGRLAEAAQQYHGVLLEGFRVGGAPEFESWLERERRELKRSWREVALTFAAELETQGRHPHAADLLKRVHQTDPLEESLFRRYFRALVGAGRAPDALQAFETFRTLLKKAAGEPESETYGLVERVRSGQGLETSTVPTKTHLIKPKPTLHTTAFVGREAELSAVARQLREPSCRLLSVLGPGGIGKTRLASEVGARLEPDFADGLCFVPFAATPSPALMVSTIASALHFAFLGERDPEEQLLEHLADKTMLLVLDNLEHLLEGAGLVAALVQAAPKLKILATSRERLNLHAEWVYDLAGMSVLRASGRDVDADAVRLFVQTAKKARADFTLGDQAHTALHICRTLGGMPLAIELAASWLRVLSVAEVADELSHGIGLLESPLRDLPERHHDLRTVFDASWQRLSEPEQVALPKLAVFQGGFSKEAARAVAAASLPLLLALINKSFVQVESSGRFSLHPLVGQYLLDKVRADAETLAHTREQHAVYFAAFMQRREALLGKAEAKTVRAEIMLELPNLRAAWFWAAAQRREELLDPMLRWLMNIYNRTGRNKEAEDLLAYAAETLDSRSVIHGRMLSSLGQVKGWQLEYERGAELLEQSIAIFQKNGSKRDEALALRSLVSNYDFSFHPGWEVKAKREEVRVLLRDLGDKRSEAWELGKLAEYYQDPQQRERALREALRLFQEVNDYFAITFFLASLADAVALSRGAYREAERLREEAIKLEREHGQAFRLAMYLNAQGVNHLYQGRLEGAEQNFIEARSISETLEPGFGMWELERALSGLGQLAHLRGDLKGARRLFTEALELNARHPDPWDIKIKILLEFSKLALTEHALTKAEDLCRKTAFDRLDGYALSEFAWDKVVHLTQLGAIAAKREEAEAAARYFQQALDLSRQWHFLPAALQLCVSFANLARQQGHERRAARLFRLAAYHPASMFETKEAAQRGLESLSTTVERTELRHAPVLTLEEIADDLRS